MRKLSRLLAVGIAAVMLLCGVAMATDPPPTITPDASGAYTIQYAPDGMEAGKMYLLLAIKGLDDEGIDTNSIIFIDQKTSGTITVNGAEKVGVEFSFIPMENKNSRVYIAGDGLDAPVLVGYITSDGKLEGNVVLRKNETAKTSAKAVVLFEKDGNSMEKNDVNGYFELNGIRNGVYKLTITRTGYITYEKKEFEINDVIQGHL